MFKVAQMRVALSIFGVTVSACALVAAPTAPTAAADDGPLHSVRYTVTSETPVLARIFYRQADPPDWATYSHDPYAWSPRADAALGPGKAPWVLETALADPAQWAMVVVQENTNPTNALDVSNPGFHCTLEVDGAVVNTNDGPKGALCSLRTW
jgi:hypothetical protein